MDLMHNQAIRILGGEYKGLYRVLLDEIVLNQTVLVRLDTPPERGGGKRGGRKPLSATKHPRKNQRLPNVGQLLWLDRDLLASLDADKRLFLVAIEPENPPPREENERQKRLLKSRLAAMEPFLTLQTFRKQILIHQGLAGLVRLAAENSGLTKSVIYRLFSQLCRFGFSEKSLRLEFNRCGAPGVCRPCDPDGRDKAGRKTMKQRLSLTQGIVLPPQQPGMTTAWSNLILAADKTIASPKPKMPQRVDQIIHSAFITRYKTEAGKLVEVVPEVGSYPNRRQIRRVLEREIPRLQRLLESTTKGHFQRNMRGLLGRNWKGVAGPGHTWAIDSTVGDIYLRSSINRAWVIGRPVVYVIVDVWSTVVVGFYVCLMGPSWDMAKLSLFSAGADPALIGALWGYEPVLSLNPAPTLCATLLCDRGEYLSRGAQQTGIQLSLDLAYTPPYRPEQKGIVEVLHRIAKDAQYHWVPGAIDARRAELELRRFNPDEAALTVPEFVNYLHVLFTAYNLTADREHRLDAHMKAAGAVPSPAGLWRWGHEMGIGFRRAVPFADLSNLLLEGSGRVRRDGVTFGKNNYVSPIVTEEAWTERARNFGGWNIDCKYFPGSVRKIWTPHIQHPGLIELDISDQSAASPELTWDEVLDARAYYLIDRAEREHLRNMTAVAALRQTKDIIARAVQQTQEAIERDRGPRPTLTEARAVEQSMMQEGEPAEIGSRREAIPEEETDSAYLETMRLLLDSPNACEVNNV